MAIRLYMNPYQVDMYMTNVLYEVLYIDRYINNLYTTNHTVNFIHRSLLTEIHYDLFNSRAINATI